jgi:alkylation response protein AidB-like acyl-CoA dehydrogenase
MSWDFETEPEFQAQLDWADRFVREEVEPLDLLWDGLQFTPPDANLRRVLDPLKKEVRAHGLWATHLGPDLGGEGHGQVKLCLLNEILGRASWAPIVFGCQAPDTGNAEILAHYGTETQKERYLRPLLEGEIFSCYSMTEPQERGSHALVHYEGVRVPADALLGGEGQAFVIAQTRLGGGRIHHAMRTIGLAGKAFDMMCERALSRHTQGTVLADKQFVQGHIADSWAQLQQFRLTVLHTAWKIDKHNDYRKVRKDIAMVKVLLPGVLHDIAHRAIQVHGALGVSGDMPLFRMLLGASVLGIADGPTEVHKVTVARQVLRDHKPSDDLWPSAYLPKRVAAARAKYAEFLEA